MVIYHRAALLLHDQSTHDKLMEVSEDFLWYGQHLQKLSGALPPWDSAPALTCCRPISYFLRPGTRLPATR